MRQNVQHDLYSILMLILVEERLPHTYTHTRGKIDRNTDKWHEYWLWLSKVSKVNLYSAKVANESEAKLGHYCHIQSAQKIMPRSFCPNCVKRWPIFNILSLIHTQQSVCNKVIIKILPHIKCVATLPCYLSHCYSISWDTKYNIGLLPPSQLVALQALQSSIK